MFLRRLYRAGRWLVLFIAFLALSLWGLTRYTGWPLEPSLRHLAAAPHCSFAAFVGMSHARRGQPGYWRHLDNDGDGIACE